LELIMALRRLWNLARLAVRYRGITLAKFPMRRVLSTSRRSLEFPSLVHFFLYEGCNLRCSMCGQWRRVSQAGGAFGKGHLPLDKLKQIIDEAAPFRPEVYIWGGEPTLHPDFIDFVRYVKRNRLVCTVNTNGTTLQKLADSLIEARVDSLDISIDGPQDVHDAVRGVKGTYSRVMAGLAKLHEGGRRRPLTKAVVTLSEANIRHVEALLAELDRNPAVDMLTLQLGWFVTPEMGQCHEARLKDDFGLAAVSWRGFLDEHAADRAIATRELIDRVERSSLRKPVIVFPNIRGEMIERYYRDPAERFNRSGCRAVFREADIRPNGDVVVCPDFPDLVIGNVLDQPLREIWRGPKLQEFRRNLRDKGLFAICTRCCGFFR